MKVAVIGCGVVGGAVLKSFATRGLDTVGYDPYINGMESVDVIWDADVVFLCLPTASYMTGAQDLKPIEETFELLRKNQYAGAICLKSTIAPGRTEELAAKYGLTNVCHNPEFLTAASPYHDFENQTAIVLGGPNEVCKTVVQAYLDAGFNNIPYKVYPRAVYSEFTKYYHNVMLALKVLAASGFCKIADALEIDFMEACEGAHLIGQVGRNHCRIPGPDGKRGGVGGFCFPKDMHALVKRAVELGAPFKILETAVEINKELRPECYGDTYVNVPSSK